MKSKVEIREFAISKAVAIMGAGTSDKDVVSKAREIEKYIIGDAEIPEVSNTEDVLVEMLKGVSSLIGLQDVGK